MRDYLKEINQLEQYLAGSYSLEMDQVFALKELKQKFYEVEAHAWYHWTVKGWPSQYRNTLYSWCQERLSPMDFMTFQPRGVSELLLLRNASDAILCKLTLELPSGKEILGC